MNRDGWLQIKKDDVETYSPLYHYEYCVYRSLQVELLSPTPFDTAVALVHGKTGDHTRLGHTLVYR